MHLLHISASSFSADEAEAAEDARAEISCMCGQYRWALSNPRQAKLTLYHCDNATEEERAQVRAAVLFIS